VKRNTSEVVREAARLNESLVQLRLERGKLQREEVLIREKVCAGRQRARSSNAQLTVLERPLPPQVHYVERVNAELHELLERYEAEFFQHQLQLEGDKQAEASHARMLQVGKGGGGSRPFRASRPDLDLDSIRRRWPP
jgi:centrosomal protein CEP290